MAFAIIMCSIPLNGLLMAATSVPQDGTRYTVILFDASGSMDGEPMYVAKQAAKKFCDSMIKADGKNYLAVVPYESSVRVSCDFSDDIDVLRDAIDNICSGGGTNINSALEKAGAMVEEMPENVIKNVVLLSDGIPESGESVEDGKYNSDDHSYYSYANAVYNTYLTLNSKCNVYTLGFFHNLRGDDLEFGQRLMKDVQNKRYHNVEDIDDLEFAFGEITNDILENTIREVFIKEHMQYVKSEEYKKDIVSGFGTKLMEVLQDAKRDGGIKGYKVLDAVTSFMNIDFESDTEDDFEFILANLMMNEQTYEGIKENFELAVIENIVNVFNSFADFAVSIEGVQGENSTINLMKQCVENMSKYDPFSKEYDIAYKNFFTCVDDIVNESALSPKEFMKNFLDNKVAKSAFVIGVGANWISDICNSVEECITCCAYGNAYIDASDDFKEILIRMEIQLDQMGFDDFAELGALDRVTDYIYLKEAIINFYTSMETYKNEGAKKIVMDAIANTGIAMTEDFLKASAILCIDSLFAYVPILRAIPALRSVLGLTQTIINLASDVDNRMYPASMLKKLYCVNVVLYGVVKDCGSLLKEDDFQAAALFDEAVMLYKSSTLLACDMGIRYEEYLLDSFTMKSRSWHSAAIVLASTEKLNAGNILCHNKGIIYDHAKKEFVSFDGKPYDGSKLKIFLVECPVSLDVRNASGKQIAFLSNTEQYIEDGYESYFHVIDKKNGDYSKIALVPKGYTVTISGTGAGEMDIFIASVENNQIVDEQSFINIPVTFGTVGNFKEKYDNIEKYDLFIDGTKQSENVEGAVNISDCQIFVTSETFFYDGKEKTPAVTVKNRDNILTIGVDYSIEYKNNVNVGIAEVIITGKGNYIGNVVKTFNIMQDATGIILSKESWTLYVGESDALTAIVLPENASDKAVTWSSSNIAVVAVDGYGRITANAAGTADITARTANGKEATCKITVVNKAIPAPVKTAHKIVLSKSNYVYNGKSKKPAVAVIGNDGDKIANVYYTVSYRNNVKVGKATVTVNLKNGYSGTLKRTFTIKPKSMNISSVASKTKGFTVKWAKRKVQTTAYQIQYSTNKRFTKKTTVTRTVVKLSTTKLTIKQLKANKKYYVRARTYKTAGGKKYRSAWSKTRVVKTKK